METRGELREEDEAAGDDLGRIRWPQHLPSFVDPFALSTAAAEKSCVSLLQGGSQSSAWVSLSIGRSRGTSDSMRRSGEHRVSLRVLQSQGEDKLQSQRLRKVSGPDGALGVIPRSISHARGGYAQSSSIHTVAEAASATGFALNFQEHICVLSGCELNIGKPVLDLRGASL
jgi:hypothetical protein